MHFSLDVDLNFIGCLMYDIILRLAADLTVSI